MNLVEMIKALRDERKMCEMRLVQINDMLGEAATALGVTQAPARVTASNEEAVKAVRVLQSWVGGDKQAQGPWLQVLECMPPVFQLVSGDNKISMSPPTAERVAVDLLVKAIEERGFSIVGGPT